MPGSDMWPAIIESVTSPLGLAALALLIAGAAALAWFQKNDSEKTRVSALALLLAGLAGISALVITSEGVQLDLGDPGTLMADSLAPDSSRPALPPQTSRVVLDLSHGQDLWNGLSGWVREVFPDLQENHDALTPASLANVSVLIMPLPHRSLFTDQDVIVISDWVEGGGGLLLLGHYAGDIHHGSNPSRLARTWGAEFAQHFLLPDSLTRCGRERGANLSTAPPERIRVPTSFPPMRGHPLLEDVVDVRLGSSTEIVLLDGFDQPDFILRTARGTNVCLATPRAGCATPNDCDIGFEHIGSSRPIVVAAYDGGLAGAGRVVLVGTWKVFHASARDNHALIRNVVDWLEASP